MMGKTAGHVLKGDKVKLHGRLQLDFVQPGSSLPKTKTAVSAAPQARIIENNPEFVVIEVTCSCGVKAQLKCSYAAAQAQTK